MQKFVDVTEQWEYHMAFNINARDATGQNVLYVTSLLGNKKLLDVLLKFKVKATRIQSVCYCGLIDCCFLIVFNHIRNLIQHRVQKLTL